MREHDSRRHYPRVVIRRSWPFISFGCSMPSTPRIVGEMSCNAPFGRNGERSSPTYKNGTGFVV